MSNPRTVRELNICLNEIEEYITSLYNVGNLEFSLSNDNPDYYSLFVRICPTVSSFAKDEENKFSTRESAEDFLQGLKEQYKKLRVMTLTMSYKPDESTISDVYSWINTHVGSDIVMDLQINNKIAGGLVIAYNGRYFDDSLRKKIDRYFKRYENVTQLL